MLRIAVIVKNGAQSFGPRPLSSERERERMKEKITRICVQNADVMENGNLQIQLKLDQLELEEDRQHYQVHNLSG